ncbi:serine hydrolase [Cellulomonas chitinilytica]|uniref:Serine hydrolase n=1 Tax=Cellulomonas chitinilytica TaxID=398759 RepID=A0A919NZM3_9CELL|nr:serine hydrolase [Cellulomonas chitinilytica]
MHGTVAPGFEGVRDAFAATAAGEPGLQAQVAAYVGGERVVDLAVGLPAQTLMPVYSTGKGAVHLTVALLAQDGVLDLDRRVADDWPEFGTHGKDVLTVRDVLTHRAGLVGVPERFRLDELADDAVLAARLAPLAPAWPVGAGYGYHAFVVGALLGEAVRRQTGLSLRDVYERRIRAPRDLDLHLGLPEALDDRVVDAQPPLLTDAEQAQRAAAAPSRDSLISVAFNLDADPPTDIVTIGNAPQVRRLGQTSAGAVGNARGLAGLYAAAIGADGRGALLDDASVAAVAALATPGPDLVTGEVDHFGLGFERTQVPYPFLGASAFGHSGAAGAQGFADPENGVAFGYARRRFAAAGNLAPEVDALARALGAAAAR